MAKNINAVIKAIIESKTLFRNLVWVCLYDFTVKFAIRKKRGIAKHIAIRSTIENGLPRYRSE